MPQIRPIGISGSIPATNQLALGDLALNVYDGKAYIKKLVDNVESIVELGGSTGQPSISASYAVTASYAETASYATNFVVSGSITKVDYIDFDTGSTVTQPTAGRLSWNNTDGTLDLGLKGGNVTLQIGQETVARVVNKTDGNLLESEFRVVRIRSVEEGGAQGQRLAVVLAQADSDADSATTLGVVTEDIANNQEGFITVFGLVRGIDTTGANSWLGLETWIDGDMLYLSPFYPGYLTNVKPTPPSHLVIVGYVEYAHQNNGKIFVKIDNGWELGELHNVLDNTTTGSYGDLLIRSGSVWTNSRSLTGSYSITGSLTISGSSTFTNIGPAIFSGSITGTTGFTGSLQGTSSWARDSVSSSYAVQADNAATINISSFGSPVESYLLMSNVVATTGVGIGGDTELRYNSSTNVLSVPAVSATSLTGSLLGTASFTSVANTASYVLNAVSSSFAVTASFIRNAVSASYVPNTVSASFASTASSVNILNQNVVVTSSLTVGYTTAGINENTLTLGPAPGGGTGEGGQLGLNATGGSYTSASFIDTWQDQFRVLRGSNNGSNAGLMYMNLQTGNTQFVGSVTASAYSGLPNDYLYTTRNTNQTIGGGTWANQDVIFNNTVVSKGISYSTVTGLAALTGGKVYRITARVAWASLGSYTFEISCYDNLNTQLGPTAQQLAPGNGSLNSSDGTLDFIYAPVSSTSIKIRTTAATTALSGEYIRGDLNTQLIIQQIA